MSEIYYQICGDGDIDVLMIHGWASSHTMWKKIAGQLKNARCWMIDLPGFGNSDIGGSALTIDAHVQTVLNFCDTHVRPQVIMGHSMGGLITLKALAIRPDIADQVVLICPVVTGKFGSFGGIASELMRNELAINALRATKTLWSTIQNEYLLAMTVPLVHSNPDLAEQVKQNFILTRPEAGIEALISMAKQNTQEYLTDILQDTLVCVSEGDTTVPVTEGRTAALYMPHAELATFTKSRHHPMDEQAEDFMPVLNEFLGRHGL